MLSFGDDEDDQGDVDRATLDKIKSKPKSAHDLIDDPSLLKSSVEDANIAVKVIYLDCANLQPVEAEIEDQTESETRMASPKREQQPAVKPSQPSKPAKEDQSYAKFK